MFLLLFLLNNSRLGTLVIKIKTGAAGIVVASFALLSGCAEYPDRIEPVYIPSIIYNGATCSEIIHERGRLASYVQKVASSQQSAASNDTGAVVIGLVVFWPALAVLPFTVDQSAHLAVARGHYEALIIAGRKYGCASDPTQGTYRYPNGKMFPGDLPPM